MRIDSHYSDRKKASIPCLFHFLPILASTPFKPSLRSEQTRACSHLPLPAIKPRSGNPRPRRVSTKCQANTPSTNVRLSVKSSSNSSTHGFYPRNVTCDSQGDADRFQDPTPLQQEGARGLGPRTPWAVLRNTRAAFWHSAGCGPHPTLLFHELPRGSAV